MMAEANSSVPAVVSNDQVAVACPPPLHLQSLEKVMKLPVIEAAYNQGTEVYEKVKSSNSLFNWALSTAEATVQSALAASQPIIHMLDRPIQFMDQTLVKGIEKIEESVPMVKEEPHKILESAKAAMSSSVQPTVEKVSAAKTYGENTACSLKDLSWKKANEVLVTQYGQMAVSGIDSTSALANKLLDYYFPATEGENFGDEPISASEDPVLHTVQTVGRLSNKAARRVYNNVSRQIRTLQKQDVKEYVASLIAVLHLSNILQNVHQRVEAPPTANGDQKQETNQNNETEPSAEK